jgi:subtilisin-like proprotein convertase family protein
VNVRFGVVAAALALGLSGCKGGGGTSWGPTGLLTRTFTIGGTVAGIAGTLVLRNNGGNDLTISANGAFTFPGAVLAGTGYNVTVLRNPVSQTCTVTNGTGTAGTVNVNATVTCVIGFSIAGVADPLATQQWHLKNTGQQAFSDFAGVAGFDINVDPVYSAFGYSGNTVTVAVVDTGLEIAHEDLAANVIAGGSWNFINKTTNPTSTATDGDHGTSVAGLIAAVRNTVGGIGVAPGASLKGFNFLSGNQLLSEQVSALGGSSASPRSNDVAIFNQSYGISTTADVPIDPSVESQFASGVATLRGGKGALYVKAAGNGFGDTHEVSNANCARPSGPIAAGLSCENANYDPENAVPYQIVVGAIVASGVKASYSTAGSAIWVSAPGGGGGFNFSVAPGFVAEAYVPAMITTDQSGCSAGFAATGLGASTFDNGGSGNTNCNYTNTMNGTSSVTAGAIALMLEANPLLTWRDVKHILATTARQIDATRAAVSVTLSNGAYIAEPAWTTNAASIKFHNWYGFGMVDASAAVNMAKTFVPAPLGPLGTFTNSLTQSGPLSLPVIPDNSTTGVSHSLVVPGTVQSVEAVQITINVTHPFTGDIGVELTSPSNTRSVLKYIRDGFATVSNAGVVSGSANLNNMVLLSNAFYGENAPGTWTIKVVDGAASNTGTLNSWSIRVYGH